MRERDKYIKKESTVQYTFKKNTKYASIELNDFVVSFCLVHRCPAPRMFP